MGGALVAIAAAVAGQAQTPSISVIGVQKYSDHVQTAASTIAATGYHFNLTGSGTGAGYAMTFTSPNPGSATAIPVALGGELYEGSYATSAFAGNGTLPTLSNGTYTIAVGPSAASLTTTATVNLTGDYFLSTAPRLGGAGLVWSNGALQIDPTKTYTFSFNTGASFASAGYALNSLTPNGGIASFYIRDNSGGGIGVQTIALYGDPVLSSYKLNAGALAPGVYNCGLEYGVLTDVNSTNAISTAFGGLAFADYVTDTEFTLVVVPEPATEAALLGLAGLLLAVGGRRRVRRR